MDARLVKYWGEDSVSSSEDIDMVNNKIYIAAGGGGVCTQSLSDLNSPLQAIPFRADFIQVFKDELFFISKTTLTQFNPKTGKSQKVPVQLPVKKTLFGGKPNGLAPSWINRTLVRENRLYILCTFYPSTFSNNGKDSSEEFQAVFIYSLPDMTLLNHVKLEKPKFESTSTFDVRPPYLYLGQSNKVIRYHLESGHQSAITFPSTSLCTAISTDSKNLYTFQDDGLLSSKLNIVSLSNFSSSGSSSFDVTAQLTAHNEDLSAKAIKKFGVEACRKYDSFVKHCEPTLSQLEKEGYWHNTADTQAILGCTLFSFIDESHSLMAVATELGYNPAFLWSTKERRPVCHLLGHSEVSRLIKIRYPYVLSTAFEGAHVWKLT